MDSVAYRVRTAGLLLVAALLPISALAAVDQNCMKDASKNLSTELTNVYKKYSDEVRDVAKNLSDNEQKAYKETDAQTQQTILQRSRQEYAYGITEANRRLSSGVYQAWNSYYARQAICDPSSPAPTYYQDPSYTGNQYYGNSYYNNTSYYQYPYSYQYGYPYAYNSYPYGYSPYTYGNQYPYGGYYQYNAYPYYNNDPYSQGYHSGVQYYNNYGVQYTSDGRYICPQVIMSPLPAGCGYDCTLDGRGCRQCEVSCRRSQERDYNCGCAQTLRPVCGRDGVTYTNECYADCAGVEVRKLNVCD